jgi:glutathione peroxidase
LRRFLYFTKVVLLSALASVAHGSLGNAGLYGFSVESINGKKVDLNEYKGKVALVVNTASRCGFTEQYKDLQGTYEKYKSKGFVILAFPSNDFAMQEPGSNAEIKKFCDLNYRVKFPMFAKGKVLGPAKQPVYKFLTEGKKFGGEISWNFEKFLVNRDGEVVARFDPAVSPADPKVTGRIEELLSPGK